MRANNGYDNASRLSLAFILAVVFLYTYRRAPAGAYVELAGTAVLLLFVSWVVMKLMVIYGRTA